MIKVKDLRDFLDGLELNCIDRYITICSVNHANVNCEDYLQCDLLGDFILDFDSATGIGHLYFYTDEACDKIDKELDYE